MSQTHLDFGVIPQGSRKTLQEVIMNTSRQPMIWLADTGGRDWLIVEPDSGVLQAGEQQAVCVTIDTNGQAAGVYTFSLSFTSEGDEVSMANNVTGDHIVPLAIHTVGLDFANLLPGSSRTLSFMVTVPEAQPGMNGQWNADIVYPAGQPQGWLTLDRTFGPFHNGPQIIHATANATGMAPQDDKDVPHTAILHFTSKVGNKVLAQTQIPLSVFINKIPFHDGGPKCPIPPPITLVQPKHGAAINHGAVAQMIFNPAENQGTVNWQLRSPVAWLKLKQDHGQLAQGGEVPIQWEIPANVNLPPGVHQADLHLSFTYNPLRHQPEWINTTTVLAHVALTVQ